ncbi:hypothetical protein BJ138DRAFT_1157840 [Hygrophoropsis aurantiaca]|uniref:Uncharacterized protein n=1 Tax=Hygrophoropsis aurantiaca TaxID=72124 RepID=A0ACB8A6S5_9AGAM|nr:hypothetical protein BJ138DRAFT_1157840 [Hygrophoropsis aurantiaca]
MFLSFPLALLAAASAVNACSVTVPSGSNWAMTIYGYTNCQSGDDNESKSFHGDLTGGITKCTPFNDGGAVSGHLQSIAFNTNPNPLGLSVEFFSGTSCSGPLGSISKSTSNTTAKISLATAFQVLYN